MELSSIVNSSNISIALALIGIAYTYYYSRKLRLTFYVKDSGSLIKDFSLEDFILEEKYASLIDDNVYFLNGWFVNRTFRRITANSEKDAIYIRFQDGFEILNCSIKSELSGVHEQVEVTSQNELKITFHMLDPGEGFYLSLNVASHDKKSKLKYNVTHRVTSVKKIAIREYVAPESKFYLIGNIVALAFMALVYGSFCYSLLSEDSYFLTFQIDGIESYISSVGNDFVNITADKASEKKMTLAEFKNTISSTEIATKKSPKTNTILSLLYMALFMWPLYMPLVNSVLKWFFAHRTKTLIERIYYTK